MTERMSFSEHLVGFLAFVWLIASAILDLVAVWVSFGGLGLVLALVAAPLAFLTAPFYAAFVLDFWWPLIVEYGGLLVLVGIAWLTGAFAK